jgi:hypothetical protein
MYEANDIYRTYKFLYAINSRDSFGKQLLKPLHRAKPTRPLGQQNIPFPMFPFLQRQ